MTTQTELGFAAQPVLAPGPLLASDRDSASCWASCLGGGGCPTRCECPGPQARPLLPALVTEYPPALTPQALLLSTHLMWENMVSCLHTHKVASATSAGQYTSFVHFSRVMTWTGKAIEGKMKGKIYFLDSKPNKPLTWCDRGNAICLAASLIVDWNWTLQCVGWLPFPSPRTFPETWDS